MNMKNFASVVSVYVDNIMGALRTAGALLVGNSVLVHFKVIGMSSNYLDVAFYGVLFGLVGSIPINHIFNAYKKG